MYVHILCTCAFHKVIVKQDLKKEKNEKDKIYATTIC